MTFRHAHPPEFRESATNGSLVGSKSALERKAEHVGSRIARMSPVEVTEAANSSTLIAPGSRDTVAGGNPLDLGTRQVMEAHLGHNFSAVRVHTSPLAHRTAHVLRAQGFTQGSEISMARGKFQPHSRSGRGLLAHELVHVMQQAAIPATRRTLQRRSDPAGKEEWLPELDEILPSGVGLLTHMRNVTTLVDIFGVSILEAHVLSIHKSAEATKVTKAHGVAGIVALYDTRSESSLDPAAALKSLKDRSARYQWSYMKTLRPAGPDHKLLEPKKKAELEAKLKKEAEDLKKLKAELTTSYKLKGVEDGDATWTLSHLKQVAVALAKLPAEDKKTLEHVELRRVRSLGEETAGQFSAEQGVTDTTVKRIYVLELADRSFAGGPAKIHETVVHEVGHAVATFATRTAAHSEFEATAESNRLVGISNAAVDEFNAAVEETNKLVEPYNEAVKRYNAARRSRDKQAIAEAKAVFDKIKKEHSAKKAEENRLRKASEQAKSTTKAAKKRAAEKGKATAKTRISASDLKAIARQKTAAKQQHDRARKVADGTIGGLSVDETSEASPYTTASQSVSVEIEKFHGETDSQQVSEDSVKSRVKSLRELLAARDAAREKLTGVNASNPALTALAPVDRAQDAWLEAAAAHSLSAQRNARVQRFVKFVGANNIGPTTIYPPDSYAEKNWPHLPEEFYSEVYSLFINRPDDLKKRSKALYTWFETNRYR